MAAKLGTLARLPIDMADAARNASVAALNQLLADTITLRDLYKKHQWQVTGASFYQLNLLFDQHHEGQAALVDTIAERILSLDGAPVVMAHDIAELTRIARPLKAREGVPTQFCRLFEAHDLILSFSHEAADIADDAGDIGTGDLIIGDIVRVNELQVWRLLEHLVAVPPMRNRA